MAKTVNIEYEVETTEATEATDNLKDATAELGDTAVETQDDLEGIGKSAKSTASGVKGLGSSIGSLVKAAGIITILVTAFQILSDALKENQEVMDFLNTGTTALQIAFNDLFNFLKSSIGPITDFFKQVFENPRKLVEDLGEAIKQNIINRFEAMLDTLGLLGKAAKQFFEGDFAGAMDTAGEASKRYVDILTGVEDTVDKLVDGTKALIDATIEYTTETLNSADAIVKQQKAMVSLESQQTRILEAANRDAELQRQIRDNVTQTIEDRIAANERLGKILEQQFKDENANVNLRIANLRREEIALGSNQERLDEIYSLETDLISLQAANVGFRSEQLINEVTLLEEQKVALQELSLLGQGEFQRSISEAEIAYDQQLELIRLNVSDEVEANELKIAAEKDLNRTIRMLETQAATDAKTIRDKDAADALSAIEKKKAAREADNATIASGAASLLGSLADLSAEEFERQKALRIASVSIDTAQAIIGTWAGYANLGVYGAVAAGIQTAAIVAMAATQIQAIRSTTPEQAAAPTAPRPNSITSASANQFTPTPQSIGFNDLGLIQDPPRAYVLESDVANGQEANRKLVRRANLG